MEKGYITIGGSKIYYEKVGHGDALIFIHADAMDTRQWDAQFDYFSKKFTVIRFDIRGFGKSETPTNIPYSFSEDLNILMKELSIPKAHFVGLSLGAAIIVDFALTHPQHVRSLVLADPGISGDGFTETFLHQIKHITDFAKHGDVDGAKLAWSNLSIFDYSRNLPDIWEKVQKMMSATSGCRWFGMNQPIDIDPPSVRRLSGITSPTLIIVGEHDIDDFKRKSHLLYEKIIGSQFVTLPNAGHLSNMDNPEAFNEAVDFFLM